MSKANKVSIMAMAGQGSFLDKLNGADPGGMDISLKVRDAISQALRRCKFSRYQAAAQMSELVNEDISKTMLDAYTAESKEAHRFPVAFVPALIHVTGIDEILRIQAEPTGRMVLTKEEAVYARVAMLDRRIDDMQRERELLLRKAISK